MGFLSIIILIYINSSLLLSKSVYLPHKKGWSNTPVHGQYFMLFKLSYQNIQIVVILCIQALQYHTLKDVATSLEYEI